MFSAVADWDFRTWLSGNAFETGEILLQDFLEILVLQLESVELDQYRTIGRMKVASACNWFHFEQPQLAACGHARELRV